MITIQNVKTLDGETRIVNIQSAKDHFLKADNLTLFPGVIDPHITCGPVDSEQWLLTIESAIKGGLTGLLDIPSLKFHFDNMKDLEEKEKHASKRLSELKIPLRYLVYGTANLEGDPTSKKSYILGSIIVLNENSLALDDQKWNRIFQLAAWEDLPVIINSQNENLLSKALSFAQKQDTRLYVLNVHSQVELDMITNARKRMMLIYAETTPQYLFPPDGSEVDFLWDALKKGIIETIGSGYSAIDSSEAKILMDGKEYDYLNPHFLLPRLLTASSQGKISLENIVRATRVNLLDVLKIERKDQDCVLVDMNKEKTIQIMQNGKSIEKKWKGWPVYTIIKGEIFTYPEHSLERT